LYYTLLKILPEILFKELVALVAAFRKLLKIVQKAANDPENCSARPVMSC
jgi:hypothetical protein